MVKAPPLSGNPVQGSKGLEGRGNSDMPNGKASNESASVRSSVIIVGAGPVGLSLAVCLGHRGVDSIILEKNSGLQQYSRAILIPPRTLDIFDGWGLLERARKLASFRLAFRCTTLSLTGSPSPLIFSI
jgi:hypothetical protein